MSCGKDEAGRPRGSTAVATRLGASAVIFERNIAVSGCRLVHSLPVDTGGVGLTYCQSDGSAQRAHGDHQAASRATIHTPLVDYSVLSRLMTNEQATHIK